MLVYKTVLLIIYGKCSFYSNVTSWRPVTLWKMNSFISIYQGFWQKMQNNYSSTQPFICTFNKAKNIKKISCYVWNLELLEKKKLSQTDGFTVFSLLCKSKYVCKIFKIGHSQNLKCLQNFKDFSKCFR